MESDERLVLTSDSLQDYFVEHVDAAVQRQGAAVEDETRAYLVQLLTSFAQRDALLTDDLEDVLDRPIALQLLDAMNGPSQRRFHRLRQIGDVCLYLTGYFSAALDRGVVDQRYYIDMGGGAYMRASNVLDGDRNPFRVLYADLAHRFDLFVDLLNDISERAFDEDRDILRLYDRFLATGSDRLAGRLQALGVSVTRTPRFAQ